MWKYFMARALRHTPDATLPQPPTLIAARISPATGQLAAAGDRTAIFEVFRQSDLDALAAGGTAPGASPADTLQADEASEIF
jgi:penicillin-binding protein 1A